MNNIFKAFNVNNDTELTNLIESLDLDYNQTIELYSSLNESMGIDGIRYIVNDLTKKFGNGSYEKLQEQLGKDNQRRKKEEISNKDPQLENDITKIENIVNNTTNVDILNGLLSTVEQKIPMASDTEQMNKLGEIKEKIKTKINISTQRVKVTESYNEDFTDADLDEISRRSIFNTVNYYGSIKEFRSKMTDLIQSNTTEFKKVAKSLFTFIHNIFETACIRDIHGVFHHPLEKYRENVDDCCDLAANQFLSDEWAREYSEDEYSNLNEWLLDTNVEDVFVKLPEMGQLNVLVYSYERLKYVFNTYFKKADDLYRKEEIPSGEEFDECLNESVDNEIVFSDESKEKFNQIKSLYPNMSYLKSYMNENKNTTGMDKLFTKIYLTISRVTDQEGYDILDQEIIEFINRVIDDIEKEFDDEWVIQHTEWDNLRDWTNDLEISEVFEYLPEDYKQKYMTWIYQFFDELYTNYIRRENNTKEELKSNGEEFDESVNVLKENDDEDDEDDDMAEETIAVDILNVDYDIDDNDEGPTPPRDFKAVPFKIYYNKQDAAAETDYFLHDLEELLDEYITDKTNYSFSGYNYNVVYNGFKDVLKSKKEIKNIPTGEEFDESYDINKEPIFDVGDKVSFVWKDNEITGRIVDSNKIGGNEYFSVVSYNTEKNRKETYTSVDPVSNQMKKIEGDI